MGEGQHRKGDQKGNRKVGRGQNSIKQVGVGGWRTEVAGVGAF